MAMEKHDLWSTSVDADHLAPQMLLEMLPNCFSQVFTMTFPKKSLACEGPLLAVSGRREHLSGYDDIYINSSNSE